MYVIVCVSVLLVFFWLFFMSFFNLFQFVFILSYYYSLDVVCFLMRDRMGVDLDGLGERQYL